MKKFNDYLEEARNLSEIKKAIILAVIVILIGLMLLSFWVSSTKRRINIIGESIRDLNQSISKDLMPNIDAEKTTSPNNEKIIK